MFAVDCFSACSVRLLASWSRSLAFSHFPSGCSLLTDNEVLVIKDVPFPLRGFDNNGPDLENNWVKDIINEFPSYVQNKSQLLDLRNERARFDNALPIVMQK